MNRTINYKIILAISIPLTIIACNQNEKKTGDTGTTDSMSHAKTDTAQPVQPAAQSPASDAVKVAPNLYRVAKDTMGIRVLEVNYKPGDSSAMHSHPDYAIYVITGGTSEFTGKDGKKMVSELKSGMTTVTAAEFHTVKNTGRNTVKVILVEVDRPQGTTSLNPTMDATKVSPDLYKIKSDSLGIRVLEVTYKPGQSSALHSHPDNAVYVVSGSTVEFTEKDGTKRTVEFKPGMIMVRPGGDHSVKNVGKTTLKVMLVEVNRPMR